MEHAWEVAGCLVVLVLFAAVLLALSRWLDARELEKWWGYGE